MNVSIRYAKALFQIAEQQNKIDLFMNELKEIELIFSQMKNLEEFFYDPLSNKTTKIDVVSTISDKLGLSKEVKNVFILLINKSREKILKEIISCYEKMYNDYKGIVKVDVYTAYDIDQTDINKLKEQVKSIFNKEPAFSITKDPSIIGGLKMKVGWTIYDGTIKTRLRDFTSSVKL